MTWYAAHVLMSVRFLEGEQDHVPVWENVYLVSAGSPEQAFAKAAELGRSNEGDDDGSFCWEQRRATWVFAGVRKLTECSEASQPPADGTELTYTEMTVRNAEELQRLVGGDEVNVSLAAVTLESSDADG